MIKKLRVMAAGAAPRTLNKNLLVETVVEWKEHYATHSWDANEKRLRLQLQKALGSKFKAVILSGSGARIILPDDNFYYVAPPSTVKLVRRA